MNGRIRMRGSDAAIDALRLRLARKLWRSAERQADAIRKRLTLDQPPAEAERDAKILAVLARTLRDLSATPVGLGLEEPANLDGEDGTHSAESLRAALRDRLAELMTSRVRGVE